MPSKPSKKTPQPKPLEPQQSWEFSAIGTTWWIGVYELLTPDKLAAVRTLVNQRIEAFDAVYSRFRPDSLVTQIAQQAGSYQFPADSTALFALYKSLYNSTSGAVTPLIGKLLSDAGYDASYSLRPGILQAPPAWEDVMSLQATTLTTRQPILLDFGAAGKGYLVDLVSQILLDNGVNQFCVDAGGDMYCHGLIDALTIGLEHPSDPSQVIGVAHLAQGSICGSAGNRRKWAGYHHIMDPRELRSVERVQAVWVYVADALTADGLATALFFVPPEHLAQDFSFDYCVIDADNRVQHSANFPAELFTKGDSQS